METTTQPAPPTAHSFRIPVQQQLAQAMALLDMPCPLMQTTGPAGELTLTFSEADAATLADALLVAARQQGR